MEVAAPVRACAHTGTEALAAQIYAAHRARLRAIARRNCVNADDAEEALQDAFVLFIEHFDADDEAPPLAWLTLTLKRRCWALYKRRRSRRPARLDAAAASRAVAGSLSAAPSSPEEATELAEELTRWGSQLSELKPDERRALLLFALGYSYREICELTGWTYTKVNRCLAEGRAKLRHLAHSIEEEALP
jgi:RNA polymerase sigma factor (sigma-70 family)